MTALTQRMEIIAGNLANIGTPGYRRQASFLRLLDLATDDEGFRQRPSVNTAIDTRAGDMRETKAQLDVAIQGEGLFAVRTPDGMRYTRSGRFVRNDAGELATPAGFPVQGEGGPVVLGLGGSIEIQHDGEVFVDGTQIGRLKLSRFARPELLRRAEHGTFEAPVEAVESAVTAPRFRQGYVEGSNVEPTLELVEMIETQRSYDRKHRAIQVINDAMQALTRAAQGL
jgi:flagellar basal body rod protein FlgG